MNMTRLGTVLVVLLAAGLYAGTASAQAFDETTISFSFADDNVLRDPGETRINSPDAYFGQHGNSYVDRFENSVFNRTGSRLVLSKKFDTGALFADGSLRMRVGPDEWGNYAFQDDGTFIRLNYEPYDGFATAVTFYPVDADRFRLGYHWDISWGGSNVFPQNFRKGLVPGLKWTVKAGKLDAFAGMKTALIRSPAESTLDNPGGNTNQYVERAYYGFLGGTGVEPIKGFRIDISGGYFEKGTSTRASVLGKPITAGGLSAQVSYHFGKEVGHRLDLRLYQLDPEQYPLDAPERYEGKFGFDAAFEFSRLVQTLEDPDHYASTKNEWSNAFFFSSGIRYRKLRVHVDGVYRDLTYIVYNVPGFVPSQALSSEADLSHGGGLDSLPEWLSGELFGVISVDYFIERLGLTPAVSLGWLLPATYKPTDEGLTIEGPYPADHATGIQKVVVRGSSSGDWDILPVGEDELPVFISKFNLKWSLGKNYSMVGELSYTRDNNFAQVLLDDHGHAKRRFDKPDILGIGVVSELKF